MRILAIVNQKGGSGKTTTAVNLAAALAEKRRRVLLVDLDPQASASVWLGVTDGGRGLWDVFCGDATLQQLAGATSAESLSLVPSSPWLVGADKLLANVDGAETLLRDQVESLGGERWDYLLMDCPPTLGVLVVNALAAAQEVLVTVESHVLALNGLVQLLATIDLVKERLNPQLRLAGILACRVDGRTRHAREVVEQLRERFPGQVFDVVIRANVRLAECPSYRQPITQYAPRSNGATDYRKLAVEILSQERSG